MKRCLVDAEETGKVYGSSDSPVLTGSFPGCPGKNYARACNRRRLTDSGNSDNIFSAPSSNVLSGNLHKYSARLVFQSIFLIWSANIAPDIFKPDGTNTSNGYPLT